MTTDIAALARQLEHLGAEDLDHLGASLRARASERRSRRLSTEEAREAVRTAPLSPAWETSDLADVGRIRIATMLLLGRGWHAEQVVDGLAEVALSIAPHSALAVEAIAAGLRDAKRLSR